MSSLTKFVFNKIIYESTNNTYLVGGSVTGASSIWYNNTNVFLESDWQEANNPFGVGGECKDIHYANGIFVATGMHVSTAENIWTSSDGIIWNSIEAFGIGGSGNKVIYANNTWVVGGTHVSTDENIYYSTNGTIWTAVSIFGTGGSVNDISYNLNFWVAAGEHASTAQNIYHSSNGITWTPGAGDPFAVGGKGLSIAVKTITS